MLGLIADRQATRGMLNVAGLMFSPMNLYTASFTLSDQHSGCLLKNKLTTSRCPLTVIPRSPCAFLNSRYCSSAICHVRLAAFPILVTFAITRSPPQLAFNLGEHRHTHTSIDKDASLRFQKPASICNGVGRVTPIQNGDSGPDLVLPAC